MRFPVVLALWALAIVLVLTGTVAVIAVDFQDPADVPFGLGFVLLGVGAASAGAVVTQRVPGNAVGPILLGMGLGLGLLLAAAGYAEVSAFTTLGPLPADAYAAWFGAAMSIPIFFGLTAFLLLLFPDGHLPSPRWRWAGWFTASGVALATVASAFTPRPVGLGFDNPFGAAGGLADAVLVLEDATDLLALPVLLLAAGALALRLRRSEGVERQQLKLFTYVAALVGLCLGVSVVADTPLADVAFLCALLSLAGLPMVAGVAILRHGLYEIDLVIKRTLVYGPLTATLVATYLLLVLVLQLVLRPLAGDSDLAVAASTLAVATLFRPLRDRIRAVVDRRFYRQRYDTAQILEAFSARLRDELDLEAMGSSLRQVVRDTVQPTHVSLWLTGTRP